MKRIHTFENFLNEGKEIEIHTVIVYMSGRSDIDWNNVKSFNTHNEAYSYAEGLKREYDIIPNPLLK